jgi:hypothetical protein
VIAAPLDRVLAALFDPEASSLANLATYLEQ